MPLISNTDADIATSAVLANATHVALFTDASFTTEQANANGYARQAISWTNVGGGTETNTGLVEFEAVGSGWTGPWYVALVTSGTYGGGRIIVGASDTVGDPKPTNTTAVAPGGKLQFAIGDMSFATV